MTANARSDFFSLAAFYPFWLDIFPPELETDPAAAQGAFAGINYILQRYNGSIPATLTASTLNWDFPNSWPPLVVRLSLSRAVRRRVDADTPTLFTLLAARSTSSPRRSATFRPTSPPTRTRTSLPRPTTPRSGRSSPRASSASTRRTCRRSRARRPTAPSPSFTRSWPTTRRPGVTSSSTASSSATSRPSSAPGRSGPLLRRVWRAAC